MLMNFTLDTLAANFSDDDNSSVRIFDIKDYNLSLLPGERCLISEVCTVLKLVLVMPSTNAMSEHSFSTLRRVKSFFAKYNDTDSIESLASIVCAQEFTDSHELVGVSNEFASKSKHRLTLFWEIY